MVKREFGSWKFEYGFSLTQIQDSIFDIQDTGEFYHIQPLVSKLVIRRER